MSDYNISRIFQKDSFGNKKVDLLLEEEGIARDKNLDYTCGMYDDDMNIIATGSCFGNTLRCLAVSKEHQGEGLLNEIITHLINVQFERGNLHLFLYTKCDTAKFFGDLGFYEIARVEDQVVFMENRRTGFADYLDQLAVGKIDAPKTAAIVVNANPFTLGHQYLIEKAAAENDALHIFIVSEDAQPGAVRGAQKIGHGRDCPSEECPLPRQRPVHHQHFDLPELFPKGRCFRHPRACAHRFGHLQKNSRKIGYQHPVCGRGAHKPSHEYL